MADTSNYFQSSLLAQQMEDIWIGSVRFNADQDLTDAQKAQARSNIGAEAFGSQLKILGHFDTVAELQTTAACDVGAAYSVGMEPPYNLYIYDGLREDWLDYGQIRATDISAVYIENQYISVSAWALDETVFVDYKYKAQIVFTAATETDLPIVAFAPEDAVGGNYAPISYAFNGYLEVWAREIPAADITIPVATVISNGGNGKGITNASGGIATGGITTDNIADGAVTAAKIADGAVSQSFTATIAADGWSGDAAPYVNETVVSGLLAEDKPIVDLIADSDYETAEAEIDAYAAIYKMSVGVNALTVYATDKPDIDLKIQLKAVRK